VQRLGAAWRLAAVLDADADIDIEVRQEPDFDMQISGPRN
jgi:hypothetical protein